MKGVKLFFILRLKRRKVSGINQANNSSGATVILSQERKKGRLYSSKDKNLICICKFEQCLWED